LTWTFVLINGLEALVGLTGFEPATPWPPAAERPSGVLSDVFPGRQEAYHAELRCRYQLPSEEALPAILPAPLQDRFCQEAFPGKSGARCPRRTDLLEANERRAKSPAAWSPLLGHHLVPLEALLSAHFSPPTHEGQAFASRRRIAAIPVDYWPRENRSRDAIKIDNKSPYSWIYSFTPPWGSVRSSGPGLPTTRRSWHCIASAVYGSQYAWL